MPCDAGERRRGRPIVGFFVLQSSIVFCLAGNLEGKNIAVPPAVCQHGRDLIRHARGETCAYGVAAREIPYTSVMKRRSFIATASGLAALPVAAIGQTRIPVVGVLDPGSPTAFLDEFRKALRGLGYIEGRTVRLEVRSGGDSDVALAKQAEELVSLKVDVIAARLTTALQAAMKATRNIPIVMTAVGGPVETGLVASLARPGGNVTGMSLGGVQLAGKRVQIIRDVLPTMRRLALVGNSTDSFSPVMAATMVEAARGLGVQAVSVPATPQDLPAALAALDRERPDAIHTMANLPQKPIADMALTARIPLFATQRSGVEAGALMSYGGRLDEQFRGAAIHVDRILKGANPATLPIEEPSRFELYVNMQTARTLGIPIPPTLLAQADDLLE